MLYKIDKKPDWKVFLNILCRIPRQSSNVSTTVVYLRVARQHVPAYVGVWSLIIMGGASDRDASESCNSLAL